MNRDRGYDNTVLGQLQRIAAALERLADDKPVSKPAGCAEGEHDYELTGNSLGTLLHLQGLRVCRRCGRTRSGA